MEPVDLPAVDALERAAFRNPWSLELMRRELTHEWSTIYLAEEADAAGGKRLLGFMVFWLVHDEVHVLNVAVAPAQRRRGVGRALLQAALERGRRHRCVLATLEARRSNAAALGLYKSFGFREVGVRPNYYADDGEDAIVMVADL
ncbi:MAG: ribosomal protein S18-alanine N-acetyltransferase [Myxococcales bacterium]|nr:ribosomal protein S18-alanine N-acetyltransferase [Myxococcales bacterium]